MFNTAERRVFNSVLTQEDRKCEGFSCFYSNNKEMRCCNVVNSVTNCLVSVSGPAEAEQNRSFKCP